MFQLDSRSDRGLQPRLPDWCWGALAVAMGLIVLVWMLKE